MKELVEVLKTLNSDDLTEIINKDVKNYIYDNKHKAETFSSLFRINVTNHRIYRKLGIDASKFSELEQIDRNRIFVYTYAIMQPGYWS